MDNHPYLLSFELDDDQKQLLIHGDPEGLQHLAQILSQLINRTQPRHFNRDHLWTPASAGQEWSEQNKGGTVINSVKIYCWKGEQPQI